MRTSIIWPEHLNDSNDAKNDEDWGFLRAIVSRHKQVSWWDSQVQYNQSKGVVLTSGYSLLSSLLLNCISISGWKSCAQFNDYVHSLSLTATLLFFCLFMPDRSVIVLSPEPTEHTMNILV